MTYLFIPVVIGTWVASVLCCLFIWLIVKVGIVVLMVRYVAVVIVMDDKRGMSGRVVDMLVFAYD